MRFENNVYSLQDGKLSSVVTTKTGYATDLSSTFNPVNVSVRLKELEGAVRPRGCRFSN